MLAAGLLQDGRLRVYSDKAVPSIPAFSKSAEVDQQNQQGVKETAEPTVVAKPAISDVIYGSCVRGASGLMWRYRCLPER